MSKFLDETKLESDSNEHIVRESENFPSLDDTYPFEAHLVVAYADLKAKYEKLIKLLEPLPTDSEYTEDELKAWLDSRNISYESGDSKSTLLNKCSNPWGE